MPLDASIFSGVCSLTYVQTEHAQTSCFQMNSETFRMLFENLKKRLFKSMQELQKFYFTPILQCALEYKLIHLHDY